MTRYWIPLLINPLKLEFMGDGNLTLWACKFNRSHNKGGAQFIGEHRSCHLHRNPPASSVRRLLQSHTLMERCRGELLRWSRRKKKWNIFPVVWTTQRAGSLDETPGSPCLRKREGDEKEGREESWSERKKQSKTERPKRPSNDWEKRKRWWETKKGEWGEKKKKPLCSYLISNGLCLCAQPWHPGSRDVIELSVKLKSPAHVWPGKNN